MYDCRKHASFGSADFCDKCEWETERDKLRAEVSETRKILAELGRRAASIETQGDKLEMLAWMQRVMESADKQKCAKCADLKGTVRCAGFYGCACSCHDEKPVGGPSEVKALGLQIDEWRKLVRTSADAIYAAGKKYRERSGTKGRDLMVLATEMHRQVGILDGKEPLPAAGERLTAENLP